MTGIMRGIFKDSNIDLKIACSVEDYHEMVDSAMNQIKIDTDMVTRARLNLNAPLNPYTPDLAFTLDSGFQMYNLLILVKNKIPGVHIGYIEKTTRPKSKNAVCCVCGEKTTNRCSGCEMVFYCSKEHQADNRNEHKCFCRLALNRTYQGSDIKIWYRMILEANL